MKKLLVVLLSMSCIIFASCSKHVAEKDDCGCFVSLTDAKADAKQNNRNILFMITNEGGDVTSTAFVSNVVKSEEFAESLAKEFTILHWDASQAAFEKTVAPADATKEEQEAAKKAETIMTENLNYAVNIGGGAYSPQFYILSKDGYPILEVQYEDFEDEIKTADFSILVHEYNEPVKMFNSMIEATETGSKEERLKAIDNVYTTTNDLYRIEMIDLWKKGVSLDKKNESGLTGKFIYSITESEAADKFNNGDSEGAIKLLVDAAGNPALGGEEIQQCYYLAAYLMSVTGSSDFKLMAEYLDKSYEAAPNTEIAPSIQGTADYYRDFDPNTMIDLDFEDSGINISDLSEMAE